MESSNRSTYILEIALNTENRVISCDFNCTFSIAALYPSFYYTILEKRLDLNNLCKAQDLRKKKLQYWLKHLHIFLRAVSLQPRWHSFIQQFGTRCEGWIRNARDRANKKSNEGKL